MCCLPNFLHSCYLNQFSPRHLRQWDLRITRSYQNINYLIVFIVVAGSSLYRIYICVFELSNQVWMKVLIVSLPNDALLIIITVTQLTFLDINLYIYLIYVTLTNKVLAISWSFLNEDMLHCGMFCLQVCMRLFLSIEWLRRIFKLNFDLLLRLASFL